MGKKLYLIRHCQTDWNLSHKIQGMQDIPLNETGRQQARLIAEAMKDHPINQVFTSKLARAKETASILANSQNVPLYLAEGLEEISYGEWEGMPMKEIQKQFPERFAQWWNDPVNEAPPGGETQMDVLRRTAGAIEAIKSHLIAERAESAAILSHGASIVCLLAWLLQEKAPQGKYSIENASITTIDWDPDTGTCTLDSLNDITHLK